MCNAAMDSSRWRCASPIFAGVPAGVCRLLLLTLFCPASVLAQLPLSIDALLMPPSTFTLSTQTHWQQHREPVLASLADSSGGALLSVGHRQVEQALTSVGMRYGFAPRLEVNARLSHGNTQWRGPGGWVEKAQGYGVDLGLSWLVRPESTAPALLLDARADLVSRVAVPGSSQQWLDSIELGVTGYRSLDPVVVSLSARYRGQANAGTMSGNPSATHSLLLAPQVNFAVNAEVTLVGGLSLQYREEDGDRVGDAPSRVATALRLGLGYAPSRRSTIFFNTRVATSGASRGAGFDLEWLYRFR